MIQIQTRAITGPKQNEWTVDAEYGQLGWPLAQVRAFVLWMLLVGLFRVRIVEDGIVVWEDGFWYH